VALPRPISDAAIELIAERLQVLADPTRIRLLALLEDGDASVQELTDRLPMPTTHQNVSKHLGVLRRGRLLARRMEGTTARYSIADYTGWWLIEQVGASLHREYAEGQELLAPAGDSTEPGATR
jgi:DNA-binding transcriptional ArsR family regulator